MFAGRINVRTFCVGVLLSGMMLAGCSNDGGKPKVHRREGWAESIDTKTKTVSMIMRLKDGKEKTITGTYTDETVVEINGRNMTIKDIKPGDPIVVFGVRSKDDGGTSLVATKVIVERKEKEWQSTGKTKKDDDAGDSAEDAAESANEE